MDLFDYFNEKTIIKYIPFHLFFLINLLQQMLRKFGIVLLNLH